MKYKLWLVAGMFLYCASAMPDSYAAGLNDTGVLKCVQIDGSLQSSCSNTGQDGEFGRDAGQSSSIDGAAGFSYAKVCNSGEVAGNGTCKRNAALGSGPDDWGCTVDRATKLVWEIRTSDGGLRDWRIHYTNTSNQLPTDATTYVRSANAARMCGFDDWRLPTIGELHGLKYYGRESSFYLLDEEWFPNSQSGFAESYDDSYWSGTNDATSSDQGWALAFYAKTAFAPLSYYGRSSSFRLRLVRGTTTEKLYKIRGNEAYDASTGLIWRRCAEGSAIDINGICAGSPTVFPSWQSALEHAKSTASETGAAWRVPNIKELESIVDHRFVLPSTNPLLFPNPVPLFYWSSTPHYPNTRDAWTIELTFGQTSTRDTRVGYPYLFLVRDK